MSGDVARDLVDALYAGTPVPPGCRVNHARGLLVEGTFVPSPAATALCLASPFAMPRSPVLARFSSSSGDLAVKQDDPRANPRGLAVCIGNASRLVLVGHSVQGFPARDGEAFLALLQCLGTAAEHPGELDRYMRAHPAARHFEAARTSLPVSFATECYHMLHPYRLSGERGIAMVGRLSIDGAESTQAGDHHGAPGADYLDAELRRRLDCGGVELALRFQPVPADVDASDVSAPWPAHGPVVELGRIRLERVADDQAAQSRLTFDPGELPAGMAFAGDPMIAARLRAYRLAFARRTADLPDATTSEEVNRP